MQKCVMQSKSQKKKPNERHCRNTKMKCFVKTLCRHNEHLTMPKMLLWAKTSQPVISLGGKKKVDTKTLPVTCSVDRMSDASQMVRREG